MTVRVEQLLNRDHVDMLIAVSEATSFSGAAARLGISQSAVSQHVKRLELATGRRLFRRTATGVEPTSDGEAVLIYARAMSEVSDDLRRHLRETAGTLKLSIGMSEDICRTALPTVLWLFLREHPLIEMRITSGRIDELIAAVRSNELDLVVTRRMRGVVDIPAFWTDKVVWVGRPDLQLPIPDPVPLVLPIEPSPLRDDTMQALRVAGRSWRVVFEARGLTGIEAALFAGIGVCDSPRSMRLFGASHLAPGHGLPDLPDAEFVMCMPDKVVGGVAAFAAVLKQAAISSFRRPDALASWTA